MQLGGRLGALSEGPFRLLWLGHTLSWIGDSLIYVAIPFAVLDLTGSATDLGFVMAAYSVSRIALLLVGGVWGDRLSRRSVMIVADAVRVVSQGSIAALLITGNAELWHLLVSQSVAGAAAAFFSPAATAFVPDTVSPARLQQANALMGISGRTVNIFGPATAGLAIAAFGPGWVFALDAATFAASAAFLVWLRVPALATAAAPKRFVEDLRDGWDAVRSRTWLWVNLLVFAVANVAAAAFVVLGPIVVADELGGAREWGLIVAVGGAGGVLGGIAALRLHAPRPLVAVNAAVLPVCLPPLLLIAPAPVLALALGYGVFVAGVALANAIWYTALQQHVPPQSLSRVSSYDWLVSAVFMPVGYALAGPAADAFGLTATLVATALVATLAPLLALLVRDVRDLRAPTRGPQTPALAAE